MSSLPGARCPNPARVAVDFIALLSYNSGCGGRAYGPCTRYCSHASNSRRPWGPDDVSTITRYAYERVQESQQMSGVFETIRLRR
jgi:hypothetical protein